MKRGRLIALLLLPALLAGCAPAAAWSPPAGVTALTTTEELPGDGADFAPQPAADAAIGALGADLLRAVHTPGENTLLSPLSITLALSMTANGAAGDTLAELEALLGAEADVLNANAGSLLDDYLALEGSTERAIANSLWMDDSMAAEEGFLERCAAFYQAEVYQADLPTEETRAAVNDWIGRVTRGMIPQMLSQPPREDAALLLVNALYMKNTWKEEFDANDTHPRIFTAADGTETELDFLYNGTRRERYFAAEDAAGVVLPYDDGRLALWPSCRTGGWTPGWRGWTGRPFPGCWRRRRRPRRLCTCPGLRPSGAAASPTPSGPWGWTPPLTRPGPTSPEWGPPAGRPSSWLRWTTGPKSRSPRRAPRRRPPRW